MRNYTRINRKLQRAILKAGLKIKMTSDQFYSKDQDRFINMFALSTPYTYIDSHGKAKSGNLQIIRTASQPEITRALADIYKAVS